MTILYYYKPRWKPVAIQEPTPAPAPKPKGKKRKQAPPVVEVDYSPIIQQATEREIERLTAILAQQQEAERLIREAQILALEQQAQELRAALAEEVKLEAERTALLATLEAVNETIHRGILELVAKKERQQRQDAEIQLLSDLAELSDLAALI
jgi:hypothetical protein